MHLPRGVAVVSSSDPTLKEGKGLLYTERYLGCAGCSMSYDWHDDTSFWHDNASTALTHSSRWLLRSVT